MGHSDADLAAQFGDKVRHAQTYLRSEMERLGLLEEDGWKIRQVTRDRRDGGTEMVLRPFHLRLTPPDGLECIVWVSAEPTVDSECAPPTGESESAALGAAPR